MSNATPYSIRESLLHLSFKILEQNAVARRNRAAAHLKDDLTFPNASEEVTIEQVVAGARNLDNFVSQRPQRAHAHEITDPDKFRGTETHAVSNLVVKINGIPFLIVNGRLSSPSENWGLAGMIEARDN